MTPRKRWDDYAIVHSLGLVIGVGLFLSPMLYVVIMSFKSFHGFLADPYSWPRKWRFGNYVEAWQQAQMARYFMNSFIYALATTAVDVFIALLLAFPVSRGYVRHSNLLYVLFLSGMFLPSGLIPLFIESLSLHLYNNRIGYILIQSSSQIENAEKYPIRRPRRQGPSARPGRMRVSRAGSDASLRKSRFFSVLKSGLPFSSSRVISSRFWRSWMRRPPWTDAVMSGISARFWPL